MFVIMFCFTDKNIIIKIIKHIVINKNACIFMDYIVKLNIMLREDFALWGCNVGKKYGNEFT